MQEELSKAIESIYSLNDANKYNVAMGYFQEYSTEAVDASGSRFADIKLHYRDSNGDDIDGTSVPLMYMGNGNTTDDFELVKGDELLVLFSDRTLEQWKTATEPQTLQNKVKDSKSSALAIPVSTTHSLAGITSAAIDSTVGRRILVKSGKKIQIGTDVDELLKILHDILLIIDTWFATSSTGNITAGSLTTFITQLGNITKL